MESLKKVLQIINNTKNHKRYLCQANRELAFLSIHNLVRNSVVDNKRNCNQEKTRNYLCEI